MVCNNRSLQNENQESAPDWKPYSFLSHLPTWKDSHQSKRRVRTVSPICTERLLALTVRHSGEACPTAVHLLPDSPDSSRISGGKSTPYFKRLSGTRGGEQEISRLTSQHQLGAFIHIITFNSHHQTKQTSPFHRGSTIPFNKQKKPQSLKSQAVRPEWTAKFKATPVYLLPLVTRVPFSISWWEMRPLTPERLSKSGSPKGVLKCHFAENLWNLVSTGHIRENCPTQMPIQSLF